MGEQREILFRAKRVDNKERVEGYYFCLHGKENVHIIVDFSGIYHRCAPAAVGQYTGLKDKNGRRIFEGDICDFTVFDCFDNDTQYRSVVTCAGSRFMLWKSTESEYYGANGAFDLDWVLDQDDELEVIGNIHDNPELLEAQHGN